MKKEQKLRRDRFFIRMTINETIKIGKQVFLFRDLRFISNICLKSNNK